MATVDVTIMGAGVFGLAIAFICQERGARVRVIDPGGPGAGASGGIVGALAPHVPEQWNEKKAFQLESLLMAGAFWGRVEAASGHATGYRRSGRLQPLADTAAVELAQTRADQARVLWQDQAQWAVVRDLDLSWAPPSPAGLWVHDTLSAHLHPRRATTALAEAVRARGGDVRREGQPEGAIVWATGWQGLAALSRDVGKEVGNGVKGQAALLQHDARGLPQLFVDGVHVVPHDDGTVAIGSTTERAFDAPETTDAGLDDVIATARAALPVLADAPVVARWAGVRPRSRSRAPMLGAWPGRPGTFIANGGFKIGFGMAPKVAEVMADLVLDGRDDIPPAFRVAASL